MKLGDPKKKPIKKSKLIKECDDLVSKIVRLREGRCITCGTNKNLTCSHLIKRGRASVRFDLDNCNCQCASCNFKHNHYPEFYTDWFVSTKGVELYHDLFERSWQTKNWKIPELIEKKLELEAMLQKMTELDKLSELF